MLTPLLVVTHILAMSQTQRRGAGTYVRPADGRNPLMWAITHRLGLHPLLCKIIPNHDGVLCVSMKANAPNSSMIAAIKCATLQNARLLQRDGCAQSLRAVPRICHSASGIKGSNAIAA